MLVYPGHTVALFCSIDSRQSITQKLSLEEIGRKQSST